MFKCYDFTQEELKKLECLFSIDNFFINVIEHTIFKSNESIELWERRKDKLDGAEEMIKRHESDIEIYQSILNKLNKFKEENQSES